MQQGYIKTWDLPYLYFGPVQAFKVVSRHLVVRTFLYRYVFVSFERWARLADWLAGLLDKRDKARAEEMYFISSLLHASSLSVSLSPLRFGKAASLTLGLPSSTSFSDKGPSLGTSIL